MQHLRVDEIIDFVSLSELNDEAVALAATVNGHIRKCQHCLRLTKAFQMIYDEFTHLTTEVDFKAYANAALDRAESRQSLELQTALEQYNG